MPIKALTKEIMYLAKVRVMLKPTVNDPEGITIARALKRMEFDSVESLRTGKYFELRLNADSEADAKKQVDDMCSKLLANPVIETYSFDLEQT